MKGSHFCVLVFRFVGYFAFLVELSKELGCILRAARGLENSVVSW